MTEQFFKKYFPRTPHTRFIFFFISDVFLISASVYFSFLLRFDFSIPQPYRPHLKYYIAVPLLILLPLFYYKKLYHFTWVYVSVHTLITICKSVTYAFLCIIFLLYIARDTSTAVNLPRSVMLIDYVLIIIFTSSIRISKRVYQELFGKPQHNKQDAPKVLIIGAGDAAEQLIRSIQRNPHYPYTVLGILDDSIIKQHTTIHGIQVLGKVGDLPKIARHEKIFGIIIAIPSAPSGVIRKIIDCGVEAGIGNIKTLPAITDTLERSVSFKDVRDIDVEDLLSREKVDISLEELSKLIRGKTILITGAAGTVGSELAKQISKLHPRHCICFDMDETGLFDLEHTLQTISPECSYTLEIGNLSSHEQLKKIFTVMKPEIVFHAAAYKHVRLMELNPNMAVINNIEGTWNLLRASEGRGVEKCILISTDKAMNPTSVMGMTKRIAEMLFMYFEDRSGAGTQYISVRFGNVLGSRGSVVPLFKKQIMSGGPVTVTHPDMKRYFMIPSEAVLLILQAVYLGKGGEIFFLDMGNPVKIVDLAKTMIELAGLTPDLDIPIVFTKPSPGEKLSEELPKNQLKPTRNKKVFIVPNSTFFTTDTFFEKIETLIVNARDGNKHNVRQQLLEITHRDGYKIVL